MGTLEKIDKRYITDKVLSEYFPSPDRFFEISSRPPKSTLEVSKERYLAFKKQLNQERNKSGQPPMSDVDITHFIKKAEGYLTLTKLLKPNKQI